MKNSDQQESSTKEFIGCSMSCKPILHKQADVATIPYFELQKTGLIHFPSFIRDLQETFQAYMGLQNACKDSVESSLSRSGLDGFRNNLIECLSNILLKWIVQVIPDLITTHSSLGNRDRWLIGKRFKP